MKNENDTPSDISSPPGPDSLESDAVSIDQYDLSPKTIHFEMPVYYTPEGKMRIYPHELPVRQTAETVKKIASGIGIDTDINLLIDQIEQSLDFDCTRDSTTTEAFIGLQMRQLDAVFGKIMAGAVGDGEGAIDTDALKLALRTQRQCLMAAEIVNRRRSRVLQTERFQNNKFKQRFPDAYG
jgi:hypothetical protein